MLKCSLNVISLFIFFLSREDFVNFVYNYQNKIKQIEQEINVKDFKTVIDAIRHLKKYYFYN